MKLSGPRITDDLLAKVRAIDGVVAAGRLFFTGNQRDLKGHDVRLWLAEPELARVWAQGIDTQLPKEFYFIWVEYAMDQRINDRGVLVDTALARSDDPEDGGEMAPFRIAARSRS